MEYGELVRAKSVRHYWPGGRGWEVIEAPKGTCLVLMLVGREDAKPDTDGPSPDAWLCASLGWGPCDILTDKQKAEVRRRGKEAQDYCGEWMKRLGKKPARTEIVL